MMIFNTSDAEGALAVIQKDLEQLKPDRIRDMLDSILPLLARLAFNIAIAAIVYLIGRYIIKLLLKAFKRFMERTSVELSVQKFLYSFINVILYGLLLFMIMDKMGVPSTSLLAILGSAGLAVGLALQGSLSNFAGGLLMLVTQPFKVGDYIIEHSKDKEGTVEAIGLFYTHLMTPDNKRVIIPNGSLAGSSVTNTSVSTKRRLDIQVMISYEADLRKAKSLLQDLLVTQEAVLKNETILVYVSELGTDGVSMGLRCFVQPADFWPLKWKLLEEIKLLLDKEGISIPYQQLDIHVKGGVNTVQEIKKFD